MFEKQGLVTLFFAVPVPLFVKTRFCVAHPCLLVHERHITSIITRHSA